jgi:membrane protein DedA with SNARE-associated domain
MLLESFLQSNIGEYAFLFFGTFIQEDATVVAGGLLVVKKSIPFLHAAIVLYLGIVTSDLAIYGLGYLARYLPWARRFVISANVEKAREKLNKHIIPTVSIVRFMPGLLFPTFLALGYTATSFVKFFIITIISAAFYVTGLLYLITKIGETVQRYVGFWGLFVLFILAAFIILLKIVHPFIKHIRSHNILEINPDLLSDKNEHSHESIPPIETNDRIVSMCEKIPPLLFYLPIGLQWIYLSIRYRSITLPTAANPNIEAGGLWGESKSGLMKQVSDEQSRHIADFTSFTLTDKGTQENLTLAFEMAAKAGLAFPFVVKPDIGWQGYGVRLIEHSEDLFEYLQEYPIGCKLIIQQPVLFEGEAGVFYVRYPGEKKGRITSLTLRYLPYLTGDGKSTIRELINLDKRANFKSKQHCGSDKRHSGIPEETFETVPAEGEKIPLSFIGSLRVGGLYRNGTRYITKTMNDTFDAIAQSMPEFYFGRFDIRFNSIGQLQAGNDFKIIEINGAGSEAIHIWDAETSIIEAYRELFLYQSLLFNISAYNRKNGQKPMSIKEFYRFTLQYQKLLLKYPTSK